MVRMAVAGDLLHHDCGMHRGSAPSAAGRVLDRFEREWRAHEDSGVCPVHSRAKAIITVEDGENCEACGQLIQDHGGN